MTVIARRGFAGLISASLALLVVLLCLGGVARAAGCDDFWQGTSGGDWATSGNWTAGVPTSASNVCLDNTHVSGSYTVDIDTYNPALVANSITVGGSTGNTVTLAILGTGGGVQVGNTLTLTNQSAGGGVTPTGAITLGSHTNTTTQPGAIDVTAGTLVNQGTITSEPTGAAGQNNVINGGFDNAGTLDLNQGFSGDGPDASSGTINIASGITARFDYSISGASFTQTGGTIANQGTFIQTDGTFVGIAGTSTGNPLELSSDNAGVTVSPSGTGSDFLHLQTGAARLGSSIGRAYTVWSSGVPGLTHGNLTTTSGSLTNAGTLELGSIDGTHGTLTVPSGTFTNTGTLVFENTANGPDGLDGALINNGTVSVPNSVQGTGQITNNGSFSLTAGTTFGAASYSQGAAGTLSLAIAGGGTPSVPELQLTNGANLAGSVAVSTSGTATGTFPVITDGSRSGKFATTHFSGENYSISYPSTGVSLTGPAAPVGKKPALHVGAIAGGKGKSTVKLSCSSGSGKCPSATIKVTVVEHLKHGKLTAVTASKKVKTTKQVTIATGSATLSAGAGKTLTLTLNKTGKGLLSRFRKLSCQVTVSAHGRKLKTANVTVTASAKSKKKPK